MKINASVIKKGEGFVEKFQSALNELAAGNQPKNTQELTVYEKSFEQKNNTSLVMVKSGTEKYFMEYASP